MNKKLTVSCDCAPGAWQDWCTLRHRRRNPPPPWSTFRLAVTGPKNVPVSGLKKDNFVLLEDNIQQTVSAFYEENTPIDIDLILALSALQRGRTDLVSIKIREAIENFRHQGNSQNKFVVEEMPFGANGIFDAMSRHITRLAQNSIAPRKMVLVLTDGFESSGGEPARALQEYAKKLDVPIYIIFAAHAGDGPPVTTSWTSHAAKRSTSRGEPVTKTSPSIPGARCTRRKPTLSSGPSSKVSARS